MSRRILLSQLAAVSLTGVGVGWLAGLSMSPVVQAIITGLVGLAAVAVAAFAGVELNPKKDESDDSEGSEKGERRPTPPPERQVNVTPVACFVLAVAIAAPLGIYVRTHQWLGVQRDALATDGKGGDQNRPGARATGVGLTQKEWLEHAKKLASSGGLPRITDGGLFAGRDVDLEAIATMDSPGQIIAALAGSDNPRIQAFVKNLTDAKPSSDDLSATDVLKAVSRELLDE